MCGFVGFSSQHLSKSITSESLSKMCDRITHRGPDDAGFWFDDQNKIAMGFRRLSIVDLSSNGHQPMASRNRRFMIVFNGEIYNYQDLRKALEARRRSFIGTSDTEILLAAIEEYGIEITLSKIHGMFAFALWDIEKQNLTLVRDRMGEKPLHYGYVGKSFVFASELKALYYHPEWNGEIDRDSVASYFRNTYVPHPHTIFKNIYKVPPGTFVQIGSFTRRDLPKPIPYWSAMEALRGSSNLIAPSEPDALNQLDQLLHKVIEREMVCDVPLGAFLSGGIDSSLIVAIMQANSSKPIETFTIGFHEQEYNEANFAQRVASHLKTSHTELYLSPEQTLDIIPSLPKIWDEPFSDSSQIPTFLVSQLAKRNVTVSLSGDGGDEVFGGYTRYLKMIELEKKFARFQSLPKPIIQFISPFISNSLKPLNYSLHYKLKKAFDLTLAKSRAAFYQRMISHHSQPNSIVIGGNERSQQFLGYKDCQFPSPISQMQIIDIESYLPNDILVKVDRASMAVSLETRAPFLDHSVVEFGISLPVSLKIRKGKGKWILHELLKRYLPESLFNRPKKGFGMPIGKWMKNDLRPWAEELLNPNKIKNQGYLEPGYVEQIWKMHLAGKYNHQAKIWDVLMFQAWLEEYEKHR